MDDLNDKDFDKQLINISLTLLVCFLGFLFLTTEKSRTEIWFSIGTVVLLGTATISITWYQHRFKIRKNIFDSEIKKFAETTLRTSLEAFNKLGRLDGMEKAKKDYESFLKENSELVNTKSKEEISFYLKMYLQQKELGNQSKSDEFIEIVAESLSARTRDVHNRCFKKPLSERYAKTKCFFDIIAFQYRIYFFALGVITFLITVVLLLT
jgi:hypothetical protein